MTIPKAPKFKNKHWQEAFNGDLVRCTACQEFWTGDAEPKCKCEKDK